MKFVDFSRKSPQRNADDLILYHGSGSAIDPEDNDSVKNFTLLQETNKVLMHLLHLENILRPSCFANLTWVGTGGPPGGLVGAIVVNRRRGCSPSCAERWLEKGKKKWFCCYLRHLKMHQGPAFPSNGCLLTDLVAPPTQ